MKYPAKRDRQAERRLGKLPKRQALHHASNHGLVDLAGLAEFALALRALARRKVAQARLATHDFPRRRDLEPLGGRFLRLATCNRFWHGSAEGSGRTAPGKLFFRDSQLRINRAEESASWFRVPGGFARAQVSVGRSTSAAPEIFGRVRRWRALRRPKLSATAWRQACDKVSPFQ